MADPANQSSVCDLGAGGAALCVVWVKYIGPVSLGPDAYPKPDTRPIYYASAASHSPQASSIPYHAMRLFVHVTSLLGSKRVGHTVSILSIYCTYRSAKKQVELSSVPAHAYARETRTAQTQRLTPILRVCVTFTPVEIKGVCRLVGANSNAT